MPKIFVRTVLIAIIVAIITMYLYDIIALKTDPVRNLFRTMSITCLCVLGLIRTSEKQSRKSLDFYDAFYADILKEAFISQPFWRKKLLCAVRLFDEGHYEKAIKYLTDLRQRCQSNEDFYAVYLFAARSYTDMELYVQAEQIYQQLINANLANSRIYSNMGSVQNKQGKLKKALRSYEYALDYDRDNANAWNNIAQAYFQVGEFEQAIPYAERALQINPKLNQASALLAIIYSLNDDVENAEKYFHMAISSGRDPKQLREGIEHYRLGRQSDTAETIG